MAKCPACGKPIVERVGMYHYSNTGSDMSFKLEGSKDKAPVTASLYAIGHGKSLFNIYIHQSKSFTRQTNNPLTYEKTIASPFGKVNDDDLKRASIWTLNRAIYQLSSYRNLPKELEAERKSLIAELERIKKNVPKMDFARREEGHGTYLG